MNSLFSKYFHHLPENTLIKLNQLDTIYQTWNEKINLISRKDMDSFILHHVIHSISIAKVISFKPGSSVLDVGTGGGFPGIPLSILFPEVSFTLADSIRKKIKVVEDVSARLELDNVSAIWSRAENLSDKYDFVISRAVTSFPVFVDWIKDRIKTVSNNELHNGILALKGGDLREELSSFSNHSVYNLKDYFDEEYFTEKKLVHLPL